MDTSKASRASKTAKVSSEKTGTKTAKYPGKKTTSSVYVPLVTHERHTWQAYAAAVKKSMPVFIKEAVEFYMRDEENLKKVADTYKQTIKQFGKTKVADTGTEQ